LHKRPVTVGLVDVAKWVDEPKQNYTDGIVGDWSKLLRLEPPVVACRASDLD
jgi:hypothetical protein